MPRRPPEEIIQTKTRFIERRIEKIKDLSDEARSAYLITMGMTAQNIALNYLVLYNPKESKLWFEKSAKYYYSSKQIKDEFQAKYKDSIKLRDHFLEVNALHMLHSCVLSENIKRMNEISINVLESIPYKSLRSDLTLEHVKSLAMLIIDSPVFFPSQINKFKELEDKYAKRLSGASIGVAKSLLAIYNSKKENLMGGIIQILCQFSGNRCAIIPRDTYHRQPV